jgi:hypothetical protein
VSGQYENARADDTADADSDEIERRQGSLRPPRFVVALTVSRLVRELRRGLARPIICQKPVSFQNSVALATNSLRRSSGDSRLCLARTGFGAAFLVM